MSQWDGEQRYEGRGRKKDLGERVRDGLAGALGWAAEGASAAWENFVRPFKKEPTKKQGYYWEDDGNWQRERETAAERKKKIVQAGLATALGLGMIWSLATGEAQGVASKAWDWMTSFVQPQSTQVVEVTPESKPPESTPEPEPTAIPEATPVKEKEIAYTQSFFDGRLAVEFDDQDKPIAYTLDGGERVLIEDGGSRLLATVDLSRPFELPTGSSEHPVLEEQPTEVLSDGELAQHGVEIIQVDRVKLFIQASAFGPGGLLEQFNSVDRKVKVVLIDAPVVNVNFMGDGRYDLYRPLLRQQPVLDVAAYREEMVGMFADAISSLESELEKAWLNNDHIEVEIIAEDITYYESVIETYRLMSDRALLIEMASSGSSVAAGRYFTSEEVGYVLGDDFRDTAVIMIAVGNTPGQEFGFISIDKNGRLRITSILSPGSVHEDPDGLVSAPDPAELLQVQSDYDPSDPSSYPYGAQAGIPMATHHEFVHPILINGWGIYPGGNYSERDTDLKTAESIQAAWDAWYDSEFKNTGVWPFVWQRSDGKFVLGRGGGSLRTTTW